MSEAYGHLSFDVVKEDGSFHQRPDPPFVFFSFWQHSKRIDVYLVAACVSSCLSRFHYTCCWVIMSPECWYLSQEIRKTIIPNLGQTTPFYPRLARNSALRGVKLKGFICKAVFADFSGDSPTCEGQWDTSVRESVPLQAVRPSKQLTRMYAS